MGMSHAYDTQCKPDEAKKLIETAIENGCTFFDTAEIYGEPDCPHHNEGMLGEIFKPYRNRIVLATKFGVEFDLSVPTVNKPVVPDFRPEQIRKSVGEALNACRQATLTSIISTGKTLMGLLMRSQVSWLTLSKMARSRIGDFRRSAKM